MQIVEDKIFVMDAIEKRRYQRVDVELLGRYMTLRAKQEFPCRTLNMSPGGVTIEASNSVIIGERVIIYLDQIGRVEGVVARINNNGFALSLEASDRKREKIADQLLWIANKVIMGMSEERSNKRVVPNKPYATISLNEGHKVPCKVENISLTGAAIDIKIKPMVGDVVALNGQIAKVIRVSDQGCALEFPPNSIQNVYTLAYDLEATL